MKNSSRGTSRINLKSCTKNSRHRTVREILSMFPHRLASCSEPRVLETVVALSDSSKANVSFISVSLHDERFQMLCCSWARHGTTITRNLQHYLQSIHVESCWTVETLGVDSKHCQNMPKCKVDVAPPATMDPWSHHPPFACIHTSCAGRNL